MSWLVFYGWFASHRRDLLYGSTSGAHWKAPDGERPEHLGPALGVRTAEPSPLSSHSTVTASALSRYSMLVELIFEIRDAEEGGFYARALGHGIFTQAETWDELRSNPLEAVSLHFEESPSRPRLVQMH